MGAGKAALELGDAQAALTFFARAEEQLPRDGRIKMWIGSALIQLQQPHAALKFFRDAAELGVPAAEIARDRGLAYDIAGNPREAQRDYRLALQQGRDDEVTRRLALSLAISGEREPALRLLEDQLLVRDRAAERTRALVLALTGDTAGATRAVQAAMPGPQAERDEPVPGAASALSPAERALAVHLGIFPGDGRTAAPSTYAANDFASAVTDAGRPTPPRLARPPLAAARAGLGRAAPPARRRGRRRRPRAFARPQSVRRQDGPGGGNPAWAWSRGLDPPPRRADPDRPPRRRGPKRRARRCRGGQPRASRWQFRSLRRFRPRPSRSVAPPPESLPGRDRHRRGRAVGAAAAGRGRPDGKPARGSFGLDRDRRRRRRRPPGPCRPNRNRVSRAAGTSGQAARQEAQACSVRRAEPSLGADREQRSEGGSCRGGCPPQAQAPKIFPLRLAVQPPPRSAGSQA